MTKYFWMMISRGALSIIAFAVLAFATCGILVTEAKSQQRISQWRTEIMVQADGSIEVTDTYELYLEERAGQTVVRSVVPARRHHDPSNPKYEYQVISASRNGQASDYKVTNNQNGLQIHIEDPDKTPGWRTYRVQYRVTGFIVFGNESDELIWTARSRGLFPLERLDITISFQKATHVKRIDVFGKNGLDPRVLQTITGTESSLTLRSQRQINPDEQIIVVFAWPRGVTADPALTKCAELLATNYKIPRSILKQSFHSLSSPTPFPEIICKFEARGFSIQYSAPGWFSNLHGLRIGDVQLWFAPVQPTPTGSVEKTSTENANARLAVFSYKYRSRGEDADETWINLSSFTEAALLLVHLQGQLPRF